MTHLKDDIRAPDINLADKLSRGLKGSESNIAPAGLTANCPLRLFMVSTDLGNLSKGTGVKEFSTKVSLANSSCLAKRNKGEI